MPYRLPQIPCSRRSSVPRFPKDQTLIFSFNYGVPSTTFANPPCSSIHQIGSSRVDSLRRASGRMTVVQRRLTSGACIHRQFATSASAQSKSGIPCIGECVGRQHLVHDHMCLVHLETAPELKSGHAFPRSAGKLLGMACFPMRQQ